MKKSYEMGYLNGLHVNSLGVRVTGTPDCKIAICLLVIIKGKICSYRYWQSQKPLVSHVNLHAKKKLEEWRSASPRFLICNYMFSGLRFRVLLLAAYKACARVHKLNSLPLFGYLVEHSLT